MAKKYEVTIQKTNARCIIRDVEDLKGVWVFYPRKICIFTVDNKTNTIKPFVEFRTSRTLPRDEVYFTLELENAPCKKNSVPKDAKKAPELFCAPYEYGDVLYIRKDVADVDCGEFKVTGTVDTAFPRRNIHSDAALSINTTINCLGLTIESAELTLQQPMLELDDLYKSLSEKIVEASSLAEARSIFKEMEGILADMEALTKVWASRSIDQICAFDPKKMRSWKYSDEAKAMGVPSVGDRLYGVVADGFCRFCAIPVCITFVNGEQIEFIHASDENKPNGFAYTAYTVPTIEFKERLFKDQKDAKDLAEKLSGFCQRVQEREGQKD